MAETLQEFILGLTFGKADEKNLIAATSSAEQAARKVETSWKGVGKSVAAGIGVIGGAVLGAAAGMFALANQSTKTLDAVAKGARNAGIASGEFQKLAYAGDLADVSSQTLGRTVQTLNRQLLDAQRGGVTPFTEALATVGLELDDLKGSATDNLGTLFDALNRIPDEGQRAALAVELLGKGGREMGSLIAGGSAELRALGDEAERFGLVKSPEAIAAAEDFQDSLTRLDGVVTGVATDIGIALTPAIDDVVDSATEWAAANREVLATSLEDSARGLADALTGLLPLMAKLVGFIGDAASEATLLAEAAQLTNEQVARETGHTPTGSIAEGAGAGALGSPIKAAIKAIRGEDVSASDFIGSVPGAIIGGIGALGEGDGARLTAAEILRNRRRSENDAARRRRAGERATEQDLLDLRNTPDQGAPLPDDLKFNKFTGQYERARRRGGRGGARKDKPVDFTEEDFELLEAEDTLGAELDRIAERAGATAEQRQEALVAASRSLAGHASVDVARKAAVSRLSSLTGVDLSPSKDPILSEIFGENVPDANLSMLAMGATPNTLIATINNSFDVDVTNQINGAGNPAEVGAQVTATVRAVLTDEVAKVTKLYKPPFRR